MCQEVILEAVQSEEVDVEAVVVVVETVPAARSAELGRARKARGRAGKVFVGPAAR
jgi:hypothetical protein